MGFFKKLQHAWNAFINNNENPYNRNINIGYGSSFNPFRTRLSRGNDRSIITSVYNRISIDCAGIAFNHIQQNSEKQFEKIIDSGINKCLTLSANKDQHSRAFFQDVVLSLFDEGTVAIIPVDTVIDPVTKCYDIESLRTGKILQWYPDNVQVEVYNDRKGIKENIHIAKSKIAIIENPLYAIMNEKNSVLQRLIRKLNLLDSIDEQSGSGKLDLIIQLPYVVKTEARKAQAEERRRDIEQQLSGSKYGIAYTDGTEKITQLNRSVENNLLKQIEYLTSMLYSQLGIGITILDGTADEKTMLNYINRTVEPIVAAIGLEMTRKFLTETAIHDGEIIKYHNEPFRLVPLEKLADIGDKFTRNAILSSNEMRQIIGFKPVNSPEANELSNKNIGSNNNPHGQIDPDNKDL